MVYRIKTKKQPKKIKRYLVKFGVTSVEINAKNSNIAKKEAISESNKLIEIKRIE